MKRLTKRSIDDEQPQKVEDHLDNIVADETFIDSNYTKVSSADLPNWFDEELFRRGQSYYDRNVLSTHVAYLTGLMAVFLVPAIAKILIFTKQSSTPCLAYKRYLQTVLLIVQLHEYDIKDSKSKFYKSLNTIRWKHSTASKRSKESNASGISQKDMVLTQFAFVGYVLLKSEKLGFTNESVDRQAFNHFWRVIGHLLGIPDRINLCRKNEYETTLLCEKIMEEIIAKTLKNPASDFNFLTDIALQGLRAIDPTFDTDVFYKLFYEIHKNEYKKQLSLYSRIMYLYRKSIITSFTMEEPTASRIDDEQSKTIDEHFKAILTDKTFINENYVKVTAVDLPSWYDEELFKRGQNYYTKNVLSLNVGYLIGLMSTFLVPTIANILLFTKQSSTPSAACTRYLQTTFHVFRLHENDEKDSKSKKNNHLEGILQRDMVMTQFGFVGYVLLKSEYLGFTDAVIDREAFNHFWRVIGYLLGIPNRLNLCRKNEGETTNLCRKIIEEIMMKNLGNSAPEFCFLTSTSVCGLRSIDPTLDTDAFYKIFYELHGRRYEKRIGLYSSVVYSYRKYTLASLKLPFIGGLLRVLWNRYVKVLLWFSEHYPFLIWINYGRKQSKLNLYPHPEI